jgi:hypothetical protein
MITIGLIKELYFISRATKQNLRFSLQRSGDSSEMVVCISPEGMMDVWYSKQHIWHENLEGDTSYFGIESCDTISRIIACIDNNTSWDQYKWKETT